MLIYKTDIPSIDNENLILIKAAQILESLGNEPGLTADNFITKLTLSDVPEEDFSNLTLAAISIETMMSAEMTDPFGKEPTIH